MAKHTGNVQGPKEGPTAFFAKEVQPLGEVRFTRATVGAMEHAADALEHLRGRMLAECPLLNTYACAPVLWRLDTEAGLLRTLFFDVNHAPDLLRDYLKRYCHKKPKGARA